MRHPTPNPHSIVTWLFVALAASLGLGGNVRAQGEREVAGTVRHADTQAPLDGAIVVAGDRRAITDRSGRFTLRMPADVLVLEVTAAGFYPFITRIDRRDGDATNVEVTLIPASGFTDTVDVVAPPPLTAGPSATAVTPVEVLHTPGALDNVFRTLQTLPGVSATDEFGSRLAVRGGAPDQNLTMMDTVEIHDPYRLFGLTSAFNPETIQRFELATGGFSVKYGDRLSSLLVVENRAGTRQRPLAGSAALSITDANVVLEGRLPRNASGSWLISGRRTYYDLVASRVADQDFPSFADVQAKGVWDLAPGRTVSVFALRSRQNAALEIDDVDARGEFNDDTRNDLVSVRFDAGIGGAGQSHTIVAYSKSTSSFGVDAAFENRSQRSNAPDDESVGVANVIFDRTLALRDVSLRQELSWVRRTHVVEGGGELHRLSTNLTFAIEGDRNPAATNGSSQQGGAGLPDTLFSPREVTRGGLWVLDRWQATPGLSLEGGLRLDRGGVNGDLHLSPRVNATYALSTRMRARAAVGRYTQSPGYEKLVQSDYVLDLTGSTAARLRSEQAWQTSLGLERDFGRIATLRVEGYVKRFNQLLVGRLETDAERTSRLARYDFPEPLAAEIPTDAIITSTPTNEGRGRSYGLDVLLSRTDAPVDARVRGWISYTWGRATRLAY
ncbi:MAG: TonB-dependent receptor, partial [Vicinamibacterales bacterium]